MEHARPRRSTCVRHRGEGQAVDAAADRDRHAADRWTAQGARRGGRRRCRPRGFVQWSWRSSCLVATAPASSAVAAEPQYGSAWPGLGRDIGRLRLGGAAAARPARPCLVRRSVGPRSRTVGEAAGQGGALHGAHESAARSWWSRRSTGRDDGVELGRIATSTWTWVAMRPFLPKATALDRRRARRRSARTWSRPAAKSSPDWSSTSKVIDAELPMRESRRWGGDGGA